MENTGNMFLMLAGIVKFDAKHDTSFFYPKYYPLLRSWADYLNASLPFPAYQLCTGVGHVKRGRTSKTGRTMTLFPFALDSPIVSLLSYSRSFR